MADISPGQFPQTPSFNAVNFRINTPTITSETNAGKIRRVGLGHSFYTFEARYPPLTLGQMGQVTGFLATAMGPMYSFEIVLPELSYSKAPDCVQANNVVTTSASMSPGARSVTLSNGGANKTILVAGDFVRFNNHSKIYMVTQDVTTGAGGTATLNFSGAAVTSVSSGTKLWITNGVPFTVILDSPEQNFDVGIGGISTMNLSMREVW